ncbi:MAG: alkaline phosphatase family protein [candidate division KSB1 bacterium]|nr:alkaline phosphatase family protein [candidate division KSB1 bacterium]MDZ7399528.1 alkaline phosphatase family protein [candidate division KSB1 bacterium]
MIENKDNCRVVIIGLEGATFNLIHPLINRNSLPFFQKLMGKASYGIVKSNLPLNSACNWTSLFTGMNPGKHNIYDYLRYDNGSYQPDLIGSDSFKAPLLWNIASANNVQTILLNAPIATCPEPLNGIMVSGMLSSHHSCYAYPESIAKQLQQQDYVVDCSAARHDDPERYFEMITQTLIKQEQVFLQLIQQYPWRLAIVTFNALGKVQHNFWRQRDKLESLYIQLDRFINQIYKATLGNTYFIVVSHHGFKSVNKKFFVNEWLWELGLLEKRITIHQPRTTDVYDLLDQNLSQEKHFITDLLSKTGLTKDNIRSVLPVEIAEFLKRLVPRRIKKFFPKEYLDILWEKTQAYFVSTNVQGININLKGREPQGIIAPGAEYEQLRNRIITELYRLRDPYTFENVIDQVYRREELFDGEYQAAAPDIIIVPAKYEYYLDAGKRTCRLFIGSTNDDYPVHAYHEPKGVFFMTGPDVIRGQNLGEISIFDIAPTVLYLLGLPLNQKFDGRVLRSLFHESRDFHFYPLPSFFTNEIDQPLIPDEYYVTTDAFSSVLP